jgi:polygalacturonase
MKLLQTLCFLFLFQPASFARDYDITTFGAKSDGTTLSTTMIQSATDRAVEGEWKRPGIGACLW